MQVIITFYWPFFDHCLTVCVVGLLSAKFSGDQLAKVTDIVGNPSTLDDLHSESDVEYDYEDQNWPDLVRIIPEWRSEEASCLLKLLEEVYNDNSGYQTRTSR